MAKHTVHIFSSYPFEKGQKIHIADGPRKGDWEVVGVTARKVTLRCPVSFREFEWNRFCYHTEDRDQPWPGKD